MEMDHPDDENPSPDWATPFFSCDRRASALCEEIALTSRVFGVGGAAGCLRRPIFIIVYHCTCLGAYTDTPEVRAKKKQQSMTKCHLLEIPIITFKKNII